MIKSAEPQNKSIESRINSMAWIDRLVAGVFTVAMWLVLLFTFFAINPVVPTMPVSIALAASFIILGTFNTASIIAMIRRYSKVKDSIYREDIVNLDRNREQRRREQRRNKVRGG